MKSFLYSLLILLLAVSCAEPEPQVPYNQIPKSQTAEYLMEMNKEFAMIEDSLINAYVDSLQLKVTRSSTGMRYYITNEGDGDSIRMSDNVTFKYSVRQLDGTVCDKLTDVVKTVNLEKGELERGFREALRMLRVSGSGVFIMPSFLAYGVIGVPKCIPAWTPVECTITVLEKEK